MLKFVSPKIKHQSLIMVTTAITDYQPNTVSGGENFQRVFYSTQPKTRYH